MKLQIYAVFDSKVGIYGQPICARARGEAVRTFNMACQDESLPFKKYAGDYRLFFIGEYNDQTGELIAFKPEPVIGADEF